MWLGMCSRCAQLCLRLRTAVLCPFVVLSHWSNRPLLSTPGIVRSITPIAWLKSVSQLVSRAARRAVMFGVVQLCLVSSLAVDPSLLCGWAMC